MLRSLLIPRFPPQKYWILRSAKMITYVKLRFIVFEDNFDTFRHVFGCHQ